MSNFQEASHPATTAETSATSTHYEILQVPSTATFDTIKTAYQQKARQLHPDKQQQQQQQQVTKLAVDSAGESDPSQAFLRLQRAWECLRDASKRRDYDEILSTENRCHTKSQGLSMKELEMVEEEESGELCYVYTCRCGEDVWVPRTSIPTAAAAASNTTTGKAPQQTSTTCSRISSMESRSSYITCNGCSLVYHIDR